MFLVGVSEENVLFLQWLVCFSRRFGRKCTNLTVAFFQFNAIGLFFCSFVQHHQFELRTSKTYSKHQNLVQCKNIDVQNFENKGSPLWCFTLGFFSALCDFFEVFGFHQRVSPSFLSIFYKTMDVKKSQRVPPFTFCGTVTLFKNLYSIFFRKYFKISQGPPFNFFSDFAPNWSFTKSKVSPFYNFEP